jgi:formylmethanofuran dehydrogenase subunit C
VRLNSFMDQAYQGCERSRRLQTAQGDPIFSLEDLAERVGYRPGKALVEEMVAGDEKLALRLIDAEPKREHQLLWGYLTSIAAEHSHSPLRLAGGSFAGLELSQGTIVLEKAGERVGMHMEGGRIFVKGCAGSNLGEGMAGGGIVAGCCRDYAFRGMSRGWGVILGDAGKFAGLGNCGGSIAVRGRCGERAGWLMRGGRLRIAGDAGEYLGLLMSGGEIVVRGGAGARAGWRMKGGSITAAAYGPEAGDGALGGVLRLGEPLG